MVIASRIEGERTKWMGLDKKLGVRLQKAVSIIFRAQEETGLQKQCEQEPL